MTRLVFRAVPFMAAALIGLSFLSPWFIPRDDAEKNLERLRSRAAVIRTEFNGLLEETKARISRLKAAEIPGERPALFALMRELCPDPDKTGISLYSDTRRLLLWYGKVIDLEFLFGLESQEILGQTGSFCVHSGSSVHLIALHSLPSGEFMAFHRLLAFLPQFRTQYLRDLHFIPDHHLKDSRINYWDFREDVIGFERVFEKHADEYVGQPNLQEEIQTIFFPLRTETGRIAATVTLGLPSLPSISHAQMENLRLTGYLLLVAFLVVGAIRLFSSPPPSPRLKTWTPALILIAISGVRLLMHLISRLTVVSRLSIFSPSQAGFLSFAGLTGSPADIFLTALGLFLTIACLISAFSGRLRLRAPRSSAVIPASAAWIVFVAVLLIPLRALIALLVRNTGLDLLKPSFKPEYLLLQMAILLIVLTHISLCTSALAVLSPILKQGPWRGMTTAGRNGIVAGLFLIVVLAVFFTIHTSSSRKARSMLEETIRTSIETQEDWGFFLLDEAIPEIEKRNDAILSLMRSDIPSDLARDLWQRTLMSRMNWYSSLDILSPEGKELSHFSLNIPDPYRPAQEQPLSPEWVTLEQTISYLGKDRDFIVAYRDWIKDGLYLGRLVLSLAVDYKMLPFLFSSTPYFELMRISTISSFKQRDFVFAVFDLQGRLLFDPGKIAIGIPEPQLTEALSGKNVPYRFKARGHTYSGLFSRNKNRIFSLFLPLRNTLGLTVDFFKMLIIHLTALLVILFFSNFVRGHGDWQNPLWSFSNRVYLSFAAIALIPLLLFTFSTQSFFSRIFSQKITEEAEVQAYFAQRMMEEFILLQQEEQVSLTINPDRILLWISSTIDNDVNLYLDGRLISSSRREFFDAGLLPELIDGELYFKFIYGNDPFTTRTEKIGDYSFHSLTLPYSFQEATLLISLPFPLEQEEITRSTAELFEFLFFLSSIFVAAVLAFARGIGGMIVKPIRRLLSATREVSLGNLEVRIPHHHRDEMKTLIDGFNAMVQSMKQHQQEVADLSKKAAWAEMARKVAHEIKNPLTPIQLSAEHLLRVHDERPGEFQAALKESTSYIIKEVENLRQIAQQFLETSQQSSLRKQGTDLSSLIRETIEPYRTTLAERIEIRLSITGADFRMNADRAKLKIVLRNLLTNAIESIRGPGRINIELTAEKEDLLIVIEDSGEGIDDELLARIFEPDFSTKDAGTGLGLPIAKKIVEDHAGTIQAAHGSLQGLRIEIRFPKEAGPEA